MVTIFKLVKIDFHLIFLTVLCTLIVSCGTLPNNDNGGGTAETKLEPGKIDAAFAHKNGHLYFFSGNKYIKWKPGKGVVKTSDEKVLRTLGVTGFKNIPKSFDSGINAAFMYKGWSSSYFLKERHYVSSEGGTPQSLNDDHRLIQKVPYSFTKDIDAVLIHPNNKIYFFQKDKYCVYDLDDRNRTFKRVKPEIKIIGKGGWRSLPGFFRSNIDAALVHPTNNNIYFFKDDKYCVWKPGKGIVEPAIRTRGVDGWKGVMFN